jgi:hypothetical protein
MPSQVFIALGLIVACILVYQIAIRLGEMDQTESR